MEEFLARERELLGDDADLFGNPAPAQPPIQPQTTQDWNAFEDPAIPQTQSIFDPQFDQQSSQFDNSTQFQQNFPPFPAEFLNGTSHNIPTPPPVEVEPAAVRSWREKFELTIAERDARSSEKQAKTVEKAKESLERFYAEYNDKKNKTIARNQELERIAANREETNPGTIWERVVKQIDISAPAPSINPAKKISKPGDAKDDKKNAPKAKDLARFKSLLISLKGDKNAPGVQ